MNYCVKEKMDAAVNLLEKPVVKNKLSWEMGVYKNENTSEPLTNLHFNSDVDIKLFALLGIAATVAVTSCICYKACKKKKSMTDMECC